MLVSIIRNWWRGLIQSIDADHPNAASYLDALDGVGNLSGERR